MKTSSRPFTSREKKELKKEVLWTPGMIVFGIFLAALVLKFFHFLHAKFAASYPRFDSPAWWIVPWLVLMVLLVVKILYQSGGERDKKIDLRNGEARCHQVDVVDAIEVEEQEDEGPGYFIRTAEGETIFFQGQYLDGYKRRSFPWTSFEIVEAPRSNYFLGLRKLGEPFKPTAVREPFTWAEMKQLGFKNFKVLDVDFETLKAKAVARR